MPACPDCGKDNPEGFQFCGFCGANLALPSRPRAEERKVVSVLFCDVVGFTSASERADPEDVRARMQPYYARLRSEIENFGGTVEKFIGDAVMAVFGAPIAHEDDAERAVRAGLRILEAIKELNVEHPVLDLSVRVGVNTGEVVVNLAASMDAGEAAVHGDAINTAARIQAAAPVNAVAVGDATYRATDRVFDYEPLEPVVAKGKGNPVSIWQAIAARARFGAEMRGHETPLVGRDVERTLLRSLFERSVRDGSVQLVTIVGEPGVGKSRLVWELETFVDDYPDLVAWRQGRCLPYGDGIAFWALGEIVKADAGILESDDPHTVAAKLERAVSPGEADREWLLARVGGLVGADSSGSFDKAESFAAWRRYLESIADSRPAVFVFEDLHWADDGLLEFLRHTAEWSEGVAVTLVCTARPELLERHADWAAGIRNSTTINLVPLTTNETAELISGLLDHTLLPAEVQQPILERSGGNPLYAEEYVRMLRDRGFLMRRRSSWVLTPGADLPLPESVHALVAARLDTLSPERKSLLQDCAVLGKVFWVGGVAAMSGLPAEDVREAVHEFSRRDLVRGSRSTTMEGEAEHFFTHVVIRDIAYGQIPRAARAHKHVASAEWIDSKAGGRVEDLADVLAFHLTQALEHAEAAGLVDEMPSLRNRARTYLVLAGDRAMRLDVGRAHAHYRSALHLTPGDHDERASVLERVATAAAQSASRPEALEAIEEARRIYEARGQWLDVGRLLATAKAVYQYYGGERANAKIREGIQILEDLPAGPELVDAYAWLGANEWVLGHDAESVKCANRALELATTLGLPARPHALAVRGAARAGLGDAGGLDDIREALELFDDTETRDKSQALNNLALCQLAFEGPAAALESVLQALDMSDRRGVLETRRVTGASAAELLFPLGRWDEAVEQATAARGAELDWETLFCEWILRDIALARGDRTAAGHEVDVHLDAARELGETQLLLPALQLRAKLAALADEQPLAVQLLQELANLPDVATSWNLPTYLSAISRLAVRLNRRDLPGALLDAFPTTTPLHEHARVAATAILAEADDEGDQAVALYTDVASRWRGFGYVVESAFAELGRSRTLLAVGRPTDAVGGLEVARSVFAGLRAATYVAEVDALLQPGFNASQANT